MPRREEFHPKVRDNGYVLTLGGFRVYVAGDTGDAPEMDGEQFAKLHRPLAVLEVGHEAKLRACVWLRG